MKNLLKIVGKTTDNKLVIAGVYSIKETLGLPLDIIFERVIAQDMVVGWIDLINEAKNAGVNLEKFMTELEYAVRSEFGKEYWENIKNYL
jgi:hypothetical protein